MRASRFTEVQIIEALTQVRCGNTAVQVCKNLGITQTTFYRWRERYGVKVLVEQREVRLLREENQKLRQIVADLMLQRIP